MLLTPSCSRLAKLTNHPLPGQWSGGPVRPAALQTNPSPDQATANDIYLAADGSEAVVKLALPGLPLGDGNHNEVRKPSSAILHFRFSPNGHHLLLNDRYMALTVPNPSIPPALEAAQISSEVEMNSLMDAGERTGKLFLGPGRYLSLDYEFDMSNRDDPGIVYYNYYPEFRLNLIGVGSGFGANTTGNFLLDDPAQKVVQINMREQNHLNSHHPNRNFTILGVKFIDRPSDYNAPQPRDAKICGFLSWRCADISDPPYYKRVWRFQFDGDGRIGSLRRIVVRSWYHMRPFMLFVVCPAWCLLLAWKIFRALRRRSGADSSQPEPLLPFAQKKGLMS